nr:helix-turn-helix transcriptional regulator [Flavihumibacter profundi]
MKQGSKKIVSTVHVPEIRESIRQLPEEDKIFVERSLEIAHFIAGVLDRKNLKQKDLAQLLGKSEAEVSKLLSGLHNYTLRSLAKIEAALGEPIVCTPVKNKKQKEAV